MLIMSAQEDRGRAIVPGPWDDEEWRPIAGYEGYDVSDWGRVRSYWVRHGRDVRLVPDSKLMKATHGCRHISLRKSGCLKGKSLTIAALVLEAFVGPRPDGMFALHRNDNRNDNRLENLYWGTPSENCIDMLRNGIHAKAKLSESDIPEIWSRLLRNEPMTAVARDYGVRPAIIGNIRSGDTWSHITQDLPGWPLVSPERNNRLPIYAREEACQREEIWEDIPSHSGYRLSNYGRLQSNRRGTPWRENRTHVTRHGYRNLKLRNDDGKQVTWLVHALVLTVFACPRPAGMFACHIDGNRLNNHAANLRWDTPRANSLDRVRHQSRDS